MSIKTVAELMDILMKGVVTLALAAGTYIFNSVQADIEANTNGVVKLQESAALKGERLATLEAWAKSSEARQDRMEAMVKEILVIARESK